MDVIQEIKSDLEKGFSKVDLEKLIGLPQNCLSNVLKGNKVLSKKSILKIEKWSASNKPNPLEKGFIGIIPSIKKQTDRKEYKGATSKDVEEIRKEKIPPERNTILGRKIWLREQEQKILQLQQK